ncbi:bacteriophage spanin2 family protein [Roseovarius mucosus]|uniref:bacteriophage spanin2 family protein n=1 Tax=Roseovarius mucosus TaxID=215743 RepID=UPI001C5E8A88|nr:bacteriophage spanin2 family protein [Roseovarius mucosus]MBW4972072.1 bacteriophage spanin2 family protein [Roseovarius mucosus]
MIRAFAFVTILVALASCGGPLSLLTGSGPNVAANVQAGKTNSQTVGQTNVTEQKLVRPQARTIEQSTGATRVRSERVETVVIQEQVPPWIWILMAVAWVLDSPARWPGQILAAFRKKPTRQTVKGT